MPIAKYPSTTDPAALAEIESRALALAAQGVDRISVRTLMQTVRDDLMVSVNNNDQTKITDSLRAKHPHLAPLIEVRDRGVRGKNKRLLDTTEVAAVLQLLSAGASIESVTVSHNGKRMTLSPRHLGLLAQMARGNQRP